ncbi:shikimate kinase [Tepidibacter formicigenes]|uniref:Shikimate kinase n=1 Tax=Tepidibacter formicigenes DSM 15518 TaxID=1123349 RepID=A0A1M6PWX3_9FIRM|nr:shikimate kinase [Tepidibacter formicigenes]SHK12429.1 shikimate kinase [Tepidibacter formicigenes DSM 15518]
MKNIVLVGFMATGKSTIGKKLSKKLNMNFIDTDLLIEEKENMNISNIFKEKGESYFRDLETSILRNILDKEGIILSTGGGIIEKEYNINLLKKIGTVIWLKANKDTIIRNLKTSNIQRPLLKTENIAEKINNLLNNRIDKYKKASDIIIKVDDKNIQEVVFNILLNLNKV